MAGATLTGNTVFPAGTLIGVYMPTSVPLNEDGPPHGALVTSATSTTAGVTFSGLTASAEYVAGAEVAGEWRYQRFAADSDPSDTLPEHVLRTTDVHGIEDTSLLATNIEWFNVKDYGATGDLIADDYAAIMDAVDAAAEAIHFAGTPAMAVVYFPAGNYSVSDTITIPDWEDASINLQGDGPFQSIIYASADLGAGNYLIDYLPPADDTNDSPWTKRVVSGLGLYGGNDIHTQNGGGIRLTSMLTLEKSFARRFKYGVVTWGNHQTIWRCFIQNNSTYGVYIHPDSPTIGDQFIGNSVVGNNTVASIGVGDTEGVFEMVDVHMGFGQYGIYGETGSDSCLNRSSMSHCYCEAFTKGFIFTNGRTMTNTSVRDTLLRHAAPGAPSTDAVFDCGSGAFQYNRIDNVALDLGVGTSLPGSFIEAGSCIYNEFSQMVNVMGALEVADWPFAVCTGAVEGNRITGGSQRATLHRSTEAIAQFEAVGVSSFESDRTIRGRRAITGDPPLGIAMHGVSATSKAQLVQTGGDIPSVPANGAIAALDRLKMVSTGDVATGTVGTDELMGIAAAAAGGGTVTVQVQTDF